MHLDGARGREKNPAIIVDVSAQRLRLVDGKKILAEYPCSTSAWGTGNKPHTKRTPLGSGMSIISKVGDGAPATQQFCARHPVAKRTGITTRILWIGGTDCPPDRYIYIHGTLRTGTVGRPASSGCVHLKPSDIIDLYPKIQLGAQVTIQP